MLHTLADCLTYKDSAPVLLRFIHTPSLTRAAMEETTGGKESGKDTHLLTSTASSGDATALAVHKTLPLNIFDRSMNLVNCK